MNHENYYHLYPNYHVNAEAFNVSYFPLLSEIEQQWMDHDMSDLTVRWWTGPLYYWHFYIGAIYIFIIFSIQAVMKNREGFQLRGALIAWNWFLTLFSAIVVLRMSPELIDVLRNEGLKGSICNARYHTGATGLWAWLFCISKVIEMGDTLFIVLRKQSLIFLHWYHHVATMMYCWFCIFDQTATARWFAVMNAFIHTIMYAYYAMRAARYRFPKFMMMALTGLQLSQMFVGMAVTIRAYQVKQAGGECQVSYTNLHVALLMYFSYVILFANFFYWSYVSRHSKKFPVSKKVESGKHMQNGDILASGDACIAAYKMGMNGVTMGMNGVCKEANGYGNGVHHGLVQNGHVKAE